MLSLTLTTSFAINFVQDVQRHCNNLISSKNLLFFKKLCLLISQYSQLLRLFIRTQHSIGLNFDFGGYKMEKEFFKFTAQIIFNEPKMFEK